MLLICMIVYHISPNWIFVLYVCKKYVSVSCVNAVEWSNDIEKNSQSNIGLRYRITLAISPFHTWIQPKMNTIRAVYIVWHRDPLNKNTEDRLPTFASPAKRIHTHTMNGFSTRLQLMVAIWYRSENHSAWRSRPNCGDSDLNLQHFYHYAYMNFCIFLDS